MSILVRLEKVHKRMISGYQTELLTLVWQLLKRLGRVIQQREHVR